MKKFLPLKQFYIGLFLFGLFLRLMILTQHQPWVDEYSTAFYSHQLSRINADSHTPFFYFFTHLFGATLGWSNFSIRIFPILTSIVHLIILLKFVVQKRLSKFNLNWYFIFICFSPLDWILSHEARMYELMLTLSSLSILYGLRYLEERNNKNLVIFTMLSTLNCFNHASILFFNAAIISYLLLISLTKKFKIHFQLIFSFLVSITPTLIYYFITNPKLKYSQGKINWIKPPSLKWPLDLFSSFLGKKYPYYQINEFYIYIALGLILILFATRLIKTKHLIEKLKRSFLEGSNGLIIPFILYHFFLVIAYPITNFFNTTYFVSLYPLFILILVDTISFFFSSELKIYAAVTFFLIIFSFFELDLVNPRLSSALHFNDFLKEKNSYLKLVCDYGRLIQSRNILEKRTDTNFLYCYEFSNLFDQSPTRPEHIEIFQSNKQASDLELLSPILEKNYELEEVVALPPEDTEVRYYKLKKGANSQ